MRLPLRSSRSRRSVLGLVCGALVAACSSSTVAYSDLGGSPTGSYDGANAGSGGAPGAPGDVGATPGGAQDIGYARKLIESGAVPPADALTVEGLLSEHDLPTEGPACTTLLCARPATAYAHSIETGKSERWIQIGMASGLTNFKRPPMDVVVLIDRSASMSIDMTQTNEAVTRMVDKLRDDDRVAVLAFSDGVDVIHPLGAPGDRAALKSKVKAIQASGGANMERGLADSFAIAKAAGANPARLRRVMLLSCGYPETTSQGPSSFSGMVQEGADAGIGFSFYGILLPFQHGLANKLSQARGGSYAYAESLDKIEKLFDTDFDYMVTPIGYDLKFSLTLPPELQVQRLYGLPGDPSGSPKPMFDVKTAFVSRRKGAIVVRVEEKEGQQAGPTSGSVRLQFTPERAVLDAPPSDTTVPVAGVASSTEASFSGVGVRKTVFLVNQLEGMKKACALWHAGKKQEARDAMAALEAHLGPEAAAIADAALDPELALVAKLAANMK